MLFPKIVSQKEFNSLSPCEGDLIQIRGTKQTLVFNGKEWRTIIPKYTNEELEQVLYAIPGCDIYNDNCINDALKWIEKQKKNA